MIEGHGDDAYKYKAIRMNFSSNVYNHVDHQGLYQHLCQRLECIRTYPEPEPYSLEQALADQLHLPAEAVCVTNGATEAIYLIAQAYRATRSAIWMPTFSEYADACRLHAHQVYPFYHWDGLPATARLVWLCNPNNPTGEVRDKATLTACIRNHPHCVFVIDQSYEAFTLKPLLSPREAADFPNVLLLHSMTKRYAVPGLRIGFITASPQLLHDIRLQRMPWSVNRLAIEAGLYLLRSTTYSLNLPALIRERERVVEALLSIGGMEAWPSDTHYVLMQLRTGKAAALKDYLATEHGILIRDASNFEGLNEHFFRIATQTPEENNTLIEAIKQWTYMY